MSDKKIIVKLEKFLYNIFDTAAIFFGENGMKKKLIYSVFMVTVSLTLMFGVLYAWWSLTPAVKVEEFVVNVNNHQAVLKLEVKRNEDEYVEVKSADDILQLFYNTLPDDHLYFRLSVTNNGNNSVTADIWMIDVLSDNDPDYDMRNVFYLADGKIVIDDEDFPVSVKSDEPVTLHDQELHLYRLTNIINDDFDLQIAKALPFAAKQTRVVEFILVYDKYTEALDYQRGILSIASLNIIFDITGD